MWNYSVSSLFPVYSQIRLMQSTNWRRISLNSAICYQVFFPNMPGDTLHFLRLFKRRITGIREDGRHPLARRPWEGAGPSPGAIDHVTLWWLPLASFSARLHLSRFESMSFVVNILACKLKIVNNRNWKKT